ncbi:MAG: DoxX family membrane protein [Acidobacteria bacterium]|nr:DoxX family membrane protein [Acidobacteriota bacterium]
MTARGWARFFCRFIVGLQFFMAGWHKCFRMTPLGHAETYFTGPYADTWIPNWLLLGAGVAIPVVELLAGLLLIAGWRTRDALVALGFVLIVVTYGHLLKEPLFSITGHIFPRGILVLLALLLPAAEDRIALDHWIPGGIRSEA